MQNKNILIIGPSAAGKTYVVQKLKRKHPFIYDADKIQNLSGWYGSSGKLVRFPEYADRKWMEEHEFLWDRTVLQKFVKENKPVVIFGLSGNCFDMLDLFDRVYYLDIKPSEIKKRLKSKNRLNLMGKTKAQIYLVVEYMKSIRCKAKDLNIPFIDASQSPEWIMDQIMF